MYHRKMGSISARAFVGAIGKLPKTTWPNEILGQTLHINQTNQSIIGFVDRNDTPAHFQSIPRKQQIVVGQASGTNPFEMPDGFKHDTVSRYLAGLDGSFSMVCTDIHTALIATDIIGAGPVYYYRTGQYLAYSNYLGLLLECFPIPRRQNRLGIVSQLLSRGQIYSQTHIDGVQRLGPGQYLQCEIEDSTGSLSVRIDAYLSVRDTLFAESGRDLSIADFDDLMLSAFAQQQPDNGAVMLSGGRDSKAIVFGLRNHKVHPHTVTYGAPDSFDARQARRLARSLDLNNDFISLEQWRFHDHINHSSILGGGCVDLAAMHNLPGFAACAGLGSQAAIGFLGDTLTGAHFGSELDVTATQFHKILLSSDRPVIATHFPEEVAEIRTHVDQLFYENADIPIHQRLMLLDLTIRQATFISTMFHICNWFIPLAMPFFHSPLMKACCSASFATMKNQRLYDQWLELRRRDFGLPIIGGWRHLLYRIFTQILRIRHRRQASARFSWLNAYNSSRAWIMEESEVMDGELGAITRESCKYMDKHRLDMRPVLTQTIPLAQSLRP